MEHQWFLSSKKWNLSNSPQMAWFELLSMILLNISTMKKSKLFLDGFAHFWLRYYILKIRVFDAFETEKLNKICKNFMKFVQLSSKSIYKRNKAKFRKKLIDIVKKSWNDHQLFFEVIYKILRIGRKWHNLLNGSTMRMNRNYFGRNSFIFDWKIAFWKFEKTYIFHPTTQV